MVRAVWHAEQWSFHGRRGGRPSLRAQVCDGEVPISPGVPSQLSSRNKRTLFRALTWARKTERSIVLVIVHV